jgi:hypothetical protein
MFLLVGHNSLLAAIGAASWVAARTGGGSHGVEDSGGGGGSGGGQGSRGAGGSRGGGQG